MFLRALYTAGNLSTTELSHTPTPPAGSISGDGASRLALSRKGQQSAAYVLLGLAQHPWRVSWKGLRCCFCNRQTSSCPVELNTPLNQLAAKTEIKPFLRAPVRRNSHSECGYLNSGETFCAEWPSRGSLEQPTAYALGHMIGRGLQSEIRNRFIFQLRPKAGFLRLFQLLSCHNLSYGHLCPVG